jgi:hypothetical protein
VIRDHGDEGWDSKIGEYAVGKCAGSNAFNAIVETSGSSKRGHECHILNPPERAGDVYLLYRLIAESEGIIPDFDEAFTQLHLGQPPVHSKRISEDRRDGGINSNADHILRSIVSAWPRVDEDLGIAAPADMLHDTTARQSLLCLFYTNVPRREADGRHHGCRHHTHAFRSKSQTIAQHRFIEYPVE